MNQVPTRGVAEDEASGQRWCIPSPDPQLVSFRSRRRLTCPQHQSLDRRAKRRATVTQNVTIPWTSQGHSEAATADVAPIGVGGNASGFAVRFSVPAITTRRGLEAPHHSAHEKFLCDFAPLREPLILIRSRRGAKTQRSGNFFLGFPIAGASDVSGTTSPCGAVQLPRCIGASVAVSAGP